MLLFACLSGHAIRLGEGGLGSKRANMLNYGRGEALMTANRPFTLIAAILLLLVAAAHACRLFTHFQVNIGSYNVPQWFSIVGLVIAGGLSFGLFREARR